MPPRTLYARALPVVVTLAMLGCSDESTSPSLDVEPDGDAADIAAADAPPESDLGVDTGNDAPDDIVDLVDLIDIGTGEFDRIPRTVSDVGQDPNGHADVLSPLGDGQVRAGRIVGAETGFAGVQAACRPGDFKLYNARVQFCVADVVPTTLYNFTGGQLIDADTVDGANERLLLTAVHNHFNVAGADTVEVVSDGSGGLAVVRVRGPEEPIRILAEIVGLLLPLRGVTFETEYRLRPDVDYIEVVSWIRSNHGVSGLRAGDVPLFGDSMRAFFPGWGRTTPEDDVELEFVAATAPGRSYAVYSPEPIRTLGIDLTELGSAYDILPLVLATGRVGLGEEGAFRRWLIVGDGGTGDLRRTMAEIAGTSLPAQRLMVTVTEDEEPAADLLLVVYDADGRARDVIVTDAEGVAELALAPGDYSVGPEQWVGGAVAPVEVTVAAGQGAQASLALPQAARLAFTVEALEPGADDPVPSPAKVMMRGPRQERLFVVRGSLQGRFRPGTYRIEISRGEEFSAEVLEGVTLVAGDNEPIDVVLGRVWDTTGLVSGEFHQHMTNSPDSDVSASDRLLSNVVEGVDFVVPSDHEYVTDYTPTIDELGYGDLIHAMPATEVSPVNGHLNPMPMTPDPTRPGNGAYAKAAYDPQMGTLDIFTFPEIVADLRANYGVRVIQLNHPRDGFGQFDTADYDPVDGPESARAAHFTTDFDSVEVFNSSSLFCRILDDWLGLVARGHRITGVGNSDTHSLGSEAGYPRNYLPSLADGPGDVTDDDILEALETGNLSVSGGALITYPGGPELGALIDVSGADTFELPVRVQTPVWSSIDQVLVIVDGDVIETIVVDEDDDVVVAVDEVLQLARPDRDTYLLLAAWGNTPMPIVTPGRRPFGFTNPVFLDADGDGSWTPPGIADASDLPGLAIPWCD